MAPPPAASGQETPKPAQKSAAHQAVTAIEKNMRGTGSRSPIPIASIMRSVFAAYMLSGSTAPQRRARGEVSWE